MVKKKTIRINKIKNPTVVNILNDLHLNGGKAVYDYKEKKGNWKLISTKIGKISKEIGIEFLYPPSTSRYNHLGFVQTPKNIIVDKQICNDKTIKFEFKKLF